MKMEKMHQNALICIRMRMLKNNTTFVKKQHVSPRTGPSNRADGMAAEEANATSEECLAVEFESFEDACAAATSQLVWNSYEGMSVDELAAFMDSLDSEVAMAVMSALEQELCCLNCFGLGPI